MSTCPICYEKVVIEFSCSKCKNNICDDCFEKICDKLSKICPFCREIFTEEYDETESESESDNESIELHLTYTRFDQNNVPMYKYICCYFSLIISSMGLFICIGRLIQHY